LKKLLPGAYDELSVLLRNNCEKIANGGGGSGVSGAAAVAAGINNATINDSNNTMNQAEKRTTSRSSSHTVLTSSSNLFLLSEMKDGKKNDIRASPGPAAPETAEVVLADPVKSKSIILQTRDFIHNYLLA
jgi:hypothetical protein